MARAATELATCEVRSATDLPCGRPAAVEILGVPFCEACAREQEAYFAIGELTRARDLSADGIGVYGGLRDEPLLKAIARLRRKLVRRLSGDVERREKVEQGALG